MGQTSKPRRVKPFEAMAKVRSLRTGARKLNLVAASIRGLRVQKALNELEFSHKRIAGDVRKALYSAISNAENNHNLDVNDLIVSEAWVGKNLVMKRFQARGRGRASSIIKPFSQITIIVRQTEEEASGRKRPEKTKDKKAGAKAGAKAEAKPGKPAKETKAEKPAKPAKAEKPAAAKKSAKAGKAAKETE